METTIQEEKLSDGSKGYNIVLVKDECYVGKLHCIDKKSALFLIEKLEELTLDFSYDKCEDCGDFPGSCTCHIPKDLDPPVYS